MADVTRSAGRSTYVRTRPADRLTAWHVREFVRALDEHGIPDSAPVTASTSDTLHTNGLSVRHSQQTEADRAWVNEIKGE